MSKLKQFTFFVLNGTTHEIATFIGQGTTIDSAFKDGHAGIIGKFQADSSGGGTVLPLNVRLPDGRNVSRMQKDFEGDVPFKDDDHANGRPAPVEANEPNPYHGEEDCPI